MLAHAGIRRGQARGVAQWLARFVRDEEAGGSSPLTPTTILVIIRKVITESSNLDGETGEGRLFTICKHPRFSVCLEGSKIPRLDGETLKGKL